MRLCSTSRRCTSGYVLLSAEGHAALAAIPRLDVDLRIVKAAHLGRQSLACRLLILQSMAFVGSSFLNTCLHSRALAVEHDHEGDCYPIVCKAQCDCICQRGQGALRFL